jgi:hypothetical protein
MFILNFPQILRNLFNIPMDSQLLEILLCSKMVALFKLPAQNLYSEHKLVNIKNFYTLSLMILISSYITHISKKTSFLLGSKWRLKFKILYILFLLSAYMKYIRESIGFTPKVLNFFFCSKHVFYR